MIELDIDTEELMNHVIAIDSLPNDQAVDATYTPVEGWTEIAADIPALVIAGAVQEVEFNGQHRTRTMYTILLDTPQPLGPKTRVRFVGLDSVVHYIHTEAVRDVLNAGVLYTTQGYEIR
jgi:hypothetical protein